MKRSLLGWFFFFLIFSRINWYSCVSVRAQHWVPLFKISLCVDPLWQERLKAEKSIGPRIWGSIEEKKWKQWVRGEDLSGDILIYCIYSSTNQEVSPQEPHGLFRCHKSRNYFMGEQGWLGWMRRQRKRVQPWVHLSPGSKNRCSGSRAIPEQTQVFCRVLTVCQGKPRLFSGCMERGERKEHEKNCDSVVRQNMSQAVNLRLFKQTEIQ